MPDIQLIINSREATQLLERAPQQFDHALHGAAEDVGTTALGLMTRYPRPPANSTYRRTRTLGRSWSKQPAQRTTEGWQVVVGSNGQIAPYNRVVQDRTRQARIHQGRWLTAQSAAEQMQSQAQRFVDARVRAALGGL